MKLFLAFDAEWRLTGPARRLAGETRSRIFQDILECFHFFGFLVFVFVSVLKFQRAISFFTSAWPV